MRLKEREYFNQIADVFDKQFNTYSKLAGRLRAQRRIKLFSSHCQLSTGIKILEIGCGTGEYTKGLVKYGSILFCTDISNNMLNNAASKMQKQSSLHFFVSDIEYLPAKNNIFDAVAGNSILHHLNIREALYQIYRVLKEGGRFAFSEPNMLNPQVFLQKNIRFLKKLSGDSPEETAFNRVCIKKLFKETGFREVKVEPFDFLHPCTPDFLVEISEQVGLVLEKIPLVKEITGSLLITGVK